MEHTGEKEDAANQSVHGRVRLGAVCKRETSRMKGVSIESSGGRKLCLWGEVNGVFTENVGKSQLFNANESGIYRYHGALKSSPFRVHYEKPKMFDFKN
jgi:hypothetical protein